MSYTTLSLRDAIDQEILTSLTSDFDMLEDEADSLVVRIYEGDTILNEYLDLSDLYAENNTAGIIVNGHLTVTVPIIDFEIDTISCFLIVNGSLTCTTLAAGCAEIIVNGDVNVAESLIAFYNHGVIDIAGDVNGKLLIVDQHGISIKGKINAATFCTGWHVRAADFSNWRHIFLPEVANELLDENDYFFAGDVRLLHMLKDGKPVFKSDLTISADKNPAPVEASWEEIKPLIQHLKCMYEAYPFANNEKSDAGMAGEKFLLYDGTTVLDELDLDIDYMSIIVVGDLHVKGSIINEDTDGACSLIVLGNLKAKNVCVGGQIIYIEGYIAVEEMLMGIYNHGELYSTSYVWCPAVITDDYHFYFHDYAQVRVLDVSDDNDKDVIRETLIDELFDEEEGFVIYDTIRQGIPLLKPTEVRESITKEDLENIINSPLRGPDNYAVAFSEDGWYITIDRGGEIDADGDTSPSSVIAIHIDKKKYFYWYLSAEDDTITTLIKEEEEWVTATEEDEEDILRHFSIVENIIKRKIKWNDRYVQKINQESLWKLVWMFRNGQEEIEFQATALVICKRVLYAATYPFAYIFSRYKDSAEHRGLPDSPHWAPAAALLDGLIEWGLAEELTREKPLAALSEELDRITNYNWGITYNIEEEYNAKPIDRNFMMAINEELLDRDGALLRLDAGIGSFIIAGMHVNDVEVFNQLMHPLGIYPKYFTYVYEEEEAALRSNAEQLLHVARERLPEKMAAYRGHQDAFREYVYHERGDVKFWQEWIEDLKTTLTVQAGSSYIFRGEDNIKPMHPEIEHWIDWCEKYDPISEGSHIIMPEED